MRSHPRRYLRIACLCAVLVQVVPETSPLLAEATTVQPVAVSAKGGEEPLAAGLIVNRRNVGDLVLYQSAGDYWIPYALFIGQSGLKEPSGTKEQTVTFSTTVGTLTFDRSQLKTFETEPYISFSSLGKAFFVKAVFDQRQFAASLDIPWSPARDAKKSGTLPAPVPDISAPGGSLSFLSIDAGAQRDFKGLSSNSLQIQAGGRLVNGVWDIDAEGDPSRQMELLRYHWTSFNDRFAVRIGTGTNLISPESVNNDFTGIQVGWNNRSILDYLDTSGRSSTDLFVSLNRNMYRTIEGSGPAAGIAELRFDGKIVARVRIRLDGRFAFQNVRMGADLRRTEVYVYERSPAEKPVAILDYTQSVMNGSLPGGELLIRSGFGRAGNPLTDLDKTTPDSGTGYAQVQYGLNDRLTLDAAAQYNPVSASGEYSVGSILSLGKNWATSLYGTQANSRYATDLRVDGHGKGWSVSYLSQWNDHDFGVAGTQQQTQQWLRFTANPIEQATLLVYGRKTRENEIETRRFLLPGAYISPWSNLRLSAVPNENSHYRYEIDQTFSPTSYLRFIHESGVGSVEWNKSLRDNLSARVLYEHAFKTGNNLVAAYFDWYPRNSRFNMVELGTSRSGKETGFTGKWIRYFNAGLRVALQYSWNMTLAQNLVTTSEYSEFIMPPLSRHFFACTLSWDLGFSGIRPFAIDRSAITTTRGGLAGKIAIDGDTKLTSSDINDVSILLDGRRLDQRQIDGSFFVGNLRPGLYTVMVDTENLPIELSAERKRMLVEVRNGAVTNVNIPVRAMYGIDGRVVDRKGNGIGNVILEVLDAQNRVAASARSNEFGDYRTDGLLSGAYRIRVVSVAGVPVGRTLGREVIIKGDYLNGIDLDIGEVSSVTATGAPGTLTNGLTR